MAWANKRDGRLWFAIAEWKEYRLRIYILSFLPITKGSVSGCWLCQRIGELGIVSFGKGTR